MTGVDSVASRSRAKAMNKTIDRGVAGFNMLLDVDYSVACSPNAVVLVIEPLQSLECLVY